MERRGFRLQRRGRYAGFLPPRRQLRQDADDAIGIIRWLGRARASIGDDADRSRRRRLDSPTPRVKRKIASREGEAPAEPRAIGARRLGRSLALPNQKGELRFTSQLSIRL